MTLARLFISGLPAAALCLLAVGEVRGQLAATSPFLPPGATPPPAPAAPEATAIELRGVLPTPNGPLFSIYNTSRRTAAYVALNETGTWGNSGSSFTVRSHRQVGEQDQVTVDYQGQTLTLSTKSPKVAVTGRGGAAGPQPAANPAAGGGGAPPAGVFGGFIGGGPGARGAGGPGAAGRGPGRGAVAAGGPAAATQAAPATPFSANDAASLSEALARRQQARQEALSNPAASTTPAAPAQGGGGRGAAPAGGRGARGGGGN
jgi:hypothetical protein